jgi:phage terminase Nu1 subunit (DNA packaging protein)
MAGKITMDTTVSLSEIALVLGLTSRRIRQLVDDGIIVTEADNKYPLADAVQAYNKFLSSKIPSEEDTKLEKARRAADAKLKIAKADRAKMETDELKGNMHRSDDVRMITEDMLYAIRNGLGALPGRLAVDVAACETAAEAYEVIKKEVHALMGEISAYKYDPNRYDEAVRDRMSWGLSKNGEDDDDEG